MESSEDQIFRRKLKTEWTAGLFHEFTEILCDNALYSIQEAEDDNKDEVVLMIKESLRKVECELENMKSKDIFLSELEQITEINLDRIDQSIVSEITDLCLGIRRKITGLLLRKEYFETMGCVTHFQAVILETIREMRENVESIIK